MWFYLSLFQTGIIVSLIFYKFTQILGHTPLNRVRHRARGTTYEVYGIGTVQTETPLNDYDKVFIYRDEDTEEWWVRRQEEFTDDRFEPLR